jgi:hypothetical protein
VRTPVDPGAFMKVSHRLIKFAAIE